MLRCATLPILLLLLTLPTAATAGTLQFFEASAGVGTPLLTGTPVTNLLLDIDYDASTAEAGGVFGFAEVTFSTTGDVLFSAMPTCQANDCFFSFAANAISLTGGDAASGEFGGVFDLMTVPITGTSGAVQITSGTYVDGTLAMVQDVPFTVIAIVPEPGTGALLALGIAGIAGVRRGRHRERAAS